MKFLILLLLTGCSSLLETSIIKPSENKCYVKSTYFPCSEDTHAIGFILENGKKRTVCCGRSL